LSRLVACPAFAQADLDTGLIDRERAFLFPERHDAPDQAYLIAALATLLREDAEARRVDRASGDPYSPWRMSDGWRLNSLSERKLAFRFGDVERTVIVGYGDGGYTLRIDEVAVPARGELGPNGTLRAELGARRLDASVVVSG